MFHSRGLQNPERDNKVITVHTAGALLPGWSENVSHTPGRVVGAEVRVPLRVLGRNANPEFRTVVHLDLPVMPSSHWDQTPQDSHTPEPTRVSGFTYLTRDLKEVTLSPVTQAAIVPLHLVKALLSSKAMALIGSSSSP